LKYWLEIELQHVRRSS